MLHQNLKNALNRSTLREIYRMNIVLAMLGTIFSLFFLLLYHNSKAITLIMPLKTAAYLFSLSFSLTAILRYCAKAFRNSVLKFRFYRYACSYFSAIAIQLLIWPLFANWSGIDWHQNYERLIYIFMAEAVLFTTIILLLQDFILIRYIRTQTEKKNALLETRTAQAENLLLKQQIHPHFLFNSLNTMKSLYKKDVVLGESYLLHLADFLRAAVSHNDSVATTLEVELQLCRNYLDLQKMRFGDALCWEINIADLAMLKGMVPAFSLQPLVENAIKHNAQTVAVPLRILVSQQDDHISVSNFKNHKKYVEQSTQSGLSNLADRYRLWCGGEILIQNKDDYFSVSFKIIPDENHNH